jgi:glycosyltransferase involved in cell wall biosynthesis
MDDPDWILEQASKYSLENKILVEAKSFADIPDEMKKVSVGILFYKPFLSELARSPTKMGEFLACGIPCITNSGIGDVDKILTSYKVGIIIYDNTLEEFRRATYAIQELLKDPDTVNRCRRAAEEIFSVDKGVDHYSKIYKELVNLAEE